MLGVYIIYKPSKCHVYSMRIVYSYTLFETEGTLTLMLKSWMYVMFT